MWEKIKLGDVAKLKNGFAFKSKDYSDEGVPVIRISDINDNLVTIKGAKRVPMKDEYNGYQIEEDSILIAMSGATTGKFGIFRSNEKALQNQRVGKFEYDEDKLSNQFLYYLLYNLKRQILKEAYGGAQPNISSKKIEEMDVEIPPLPTQNRIVEKIEELFSELDNGVENLEKAQKQLKTYRQAVLKDAFEGKLTKEWREQQVDLPTPEELLRQIKAERKAHRQQELAEWEKEVEQWEKDGEPGRKPRRPSKLDSPDKPNQEHEDRKWEIPKNWLWTQLGYLSFVTKLAGFEYTKYVEYDDDGDIPVIKAENAGKNGFKPTDFSFVKSETVSNLERSKIDGGELLVVFVGAGTGNVALVPKDRKYFLGPNIAMAKPYAKANMKYIEYFFQSHLGKNLMMAAMKAVAQPSLNMGTIRQSPLALPSLKEQKEIVNEIESRLSVVDQLEQTIKENLQKAEALRQSILKKAFGGELVVEDSAKILEFQKSPQRYYENTPTDLHAGLMCKIVDAHYKNEKYLQKLNHVKCEKIIHMLESHEGIELERKPVKDAAGPDDYPRLKKIEHRARFKNWFEKDESLGGKFGYGYKPKKSLEYAISDLEKIEGLPLKAIDKMIGIFLKMDKEEAEIVATLYAAWNNFLINGHRPTDEEIVRAAREDWSKQKLSIKRERFIKALPWMRDQKLVPSGKGKKVLDRHK